MPGFPKMADAKKEMVDDVGDTTVVITQVDPAAAKQKTTKKYVIISVSILLAAAIILTAILVGMYMFTEAQKELVKYTLHFDNNAKQDVMSDPNTNVVKYQIQNAGQTAWVVNDFNRDIQVVKIQTAAQTNCYVSPLNRTTAQDPSQITGPETKEVTKTATLTYVTSGSPITDISFLSEMAQELCITVSTYWLYPKCLDNSNSGPYSTVPPPTTMKPTTPFAPATSNPIDNSPWYIYWYYPYNANVTAVCVTGCCKTVCACAVDYYWIYSANSLTCAWVAHSCPTLGVTENPLSQSCTNGPAGLKCPNYSPATLPYC